MKILVINAGSSSCKYQLFNMDDQSVLCSGVVERIGQPMGKLSHKIAPGSDKEEKIIVERPFPTHVEGMEDVISLLLDSEKGVIQDKSEISAIGHRVLHGGEAITDPVLIDDKVKEIIRDCFPLGPLHNPANLMGIDVAEKLFPGVPNVGVFDTEFGMTLAPEAYLYPLPYSLYEELRIRRYGFHGTSHRYVSHRVAELMGKDIKDLKLITCHIGNGSSITAIKNGKVIDTSMGLTPLDGFMMGTRTGTLDPSVVTFIAEKENLTPAQLSDLFNKKSGLLGISGISSDDRDICKAEDEGNERAHLAHEMLVYQIQKFIGSYVAALNGVDAIVFTAGLGENQDTLRERICTNMEYLGIKFDHEANKGVRGKEKKISAPDSKVAVYIVPTNEELVIARDTKAIVEKL